MTNIGRSVKVSFVLGIISLFALVPMHLALTDIAKGEGDVALEWWAVRMAVLAILTFQIVALWTFFRIGRKGGDRQLS